MAQCRVEDRVELAVSAAAVWDLIGDFGDLSWIPGIGDVKMSVQGEGVGALRSIELEGGLVVEKLESYQDGASYSYSVASGPLPITNYLAVLAVEPRGSGCQLSWSSDFDAKGVPVAEAQGFVAELYSSGLAAVKQQLEG
ncbi:MAG: SRPBCC family protein [Gammaproteobacteria bacterium]|nr:SRPBCC family protein [Gammaproteobacteria bacterium]